MVVRIYMGGSRNMAWRRVVTEFEADLYQVPVPRLFKFPKGEAEFKEYSDGERKIEISLWDLKVQDGATASLRLNGEDMCEVQIVRGRGKLELSSKEITNIAEINNGDVLEVYTDGKVLLEGIFAPDD